MLISRNFLCHGRLAVLAVLLLGAVSCASGTMTADRSPAYLIVDRLQASGGKFTGVGLLGDTLNSDVQTIVQLNINGQQVRVPTVFNDLGQASIRLALKNPGTATTPTSPTSVNAITLTRYHVNFRRADGQNRPGVDVPFAFDGGLGVTIGENLVTFTFDLVRQSAKEEPPLSNLIGGGGAIMIHTIAEITFYGHDQAGNAVSVTANINVNFGDFADPA